MPCRTGTHPIEREEALQLAKEIPLWTLKDKSVEREYKLDGFREAIEFVNGIADIAEADDHHPDICIYYDKVRVELSTHKIGGLSRNDFIVAAKIDRLA